MSALTIAQKPRITLDQLRELSREQRRVADAFSNPFARLGFGTNSLLEGTSYPFNRLTRNYVLMQSLYRGNWIVRRVVDGIAEDMVSKWITLVNEMSPQQIDKFNRCIDTTQTEKRLTEAIKWARLFGGAGAIMVIDGEDDLEKPLDVEAIELDSYRGLIVFDRWSGITPSAKICTDINRPLEFGLPETYRVNTSTARSFTVHASRVLRFTGPEVPDWERQVEQNWGISEIEVIYEELKKRDNTSFNIANLVFRANIVELKSKGLSQMLSGLTSSAAVQTQFYRILMAQNDIMSNQGMLVTDPEGGMSQHSYSFAGINDIYQSFMLDLCGATGYSMTRLFGRTMTGLGQGNEGDERNYEAMVSQKQKRELHPNLLKLIPVIAMSKWGKIPKDLDWQYNPLRTLTNEEMAKIADSISKNVNDVFNSGIIGRKTALKELKTASEFTPYFSNITNEMIEEADDEPMSMGAQGEEPLDPNGLPNESATDQVMAEESVREKGGDSGGELEESEEEKQATDALPNAKVFDFPKALHQLVEDAAQWEENKHARAGKGQTRGNSKGGQFVSKGQGGGGASATPQVKSGNQLASPSGERGKNPELRKSLEGL